MAGLADSTRERFSSWLGVLASMTGVAVGLGNVWRFPYMVGRFGGAPFVLVYIAAVVLLGIPVLLAEWILGRATRRGPVGAFERAGLPCGTAVGWIFFAGVAAASAYYANAVGWVLYHAVAEFAALCGVPVRGAAILPPQQGLDPGALVRQLVCTTTVILACAVVLVRGLRRGIERVSRRITPLLFALLIVLGLRSLSLPGADGGLRWYLFKFELSALTPRVMVAALGQAFFSLSLGGTFMVVYGSYLRRRQPIRGLAAGTAIGDLLAGLLAGLAVVPAVLALGLEPSSGPALLFATLPRVFARMPLGNLFGTLFYAGLLLAAYLSLLAALEVLVAGVVDNRRVDRRRATWIVASGVCLLAIPTMINMEVFVPWDLTFGSGFQTAGALLVVVTVCWVMRRYDALTQLAAGRVPGWPIHLLYVWLRWVVPLAILTVGLAWLLGEVLGLPTIP